MAPNYRSLVPGGFFSSTPFDRTMPVSIRCNNPGAINGTTWEKRYPGYVDTVETTPGNKTTIFEAPEYGVAVWWELLRRYAAANVTTLGGIINRYGGGQDYSNYIRFVQHKTGFDEDKQTSLDDDAVLSAFGKAMFAYEAGRATPLSDNQIVFGLRLGRADGDITAVHTGGPSPLFIAARVASATQTVPDKECIPQLIRLGNSVESLHRIQDIAAKSMKAAGYGYTMHNACAATLSTFLQEAGIAVPTTLGAGRLAKRLNQDRDWVRIDVGQQAAGDVGVAKNDVHIYLVARTNGADEMTIADNQASTPHTRFASGKGGKTPTAYFLRAPDKAPQHVASLILATTTQVDQDFYPTDDEDTNQLTELRSEEISPPYE
jgi:hypothetical protein